MTITQDWAYAKAKKERQRVMFKGKGATKFWGILAREIIILLAILVVYIFTNPGEYQGEFTQVPFAQLTIGQIIAGVFRWGILLFLFYKLLKIPSADDYGSDYDAMETLEIWAQFGWAFLGLLLLGIIVLFLWFSQGTHNLFAGSASFLVVIFVTVFYLFKGIKELVRNPQKIGTGGIFSAAAHKVTHPSKLWKWFLILITPFVLIAIYLSIMIYISTAGK